MLGGGMSNGGYAFEISPFLGYYLDDYDRLSIGAGPIVQLQGGNNGYQRIRANVFGMRSFARYDILKSMGIFTQVEADYQYYTLSVTEISSGYKYKDGVGVPGLYAGAGLNFGGTYLMGLYSFLWTQKDADRGLAPPIPFILRFGFNFNLGGN